MKVITIAIPTFNRADKLRIALDAIKKLVIPSDLKLNVAVSNSHSTDSTFELLNNASLSNANLIINNYKYTEFNNWVAVSKLVPLDSDYVWLHGDDDIIFNPNALVILNDLNCFNGNNSIQSIPATRRVANTGVHRSYLGNLSNKYGAHEILGWMSSLIVDFNSYSSFIEYYGKLFSGNPNVEETHKRRIGNLTHMTYFIENHWDASTCLIDLPIIDEQVHPDFKKIEALKRRNFEFPQNYLFSDRFFFDAENLVRIASKNNLQNCDKFFRYTTKSLIDVLVAITLDELQSRSIQGRISLDEKLAFIENLSRSMGSHKNAEVVKLIIRNIKEGHFSKQPYLLLHNSYEPFIYPSTVVI